MKKFAAWLLVLSVLFAFAGCKGSTTTTDTSGDGDASRSVGAVDVTFEDKGTAYPDEKIGFQTEAPEKGEQIAIMHTSMGDISIRLFPEAAPKAVENFVTHAKDGYYDGLTFHRVIQDFMIQGGDPTGDGNGGESIWGEKFEDEFDEKLLNITGALSMANSGVNTNGSQFFINQCKSGQVKAEDYAQNTEEYLKEYYARYYENYCAQYSDFKTYYPTAADFMMDQCSTPVYDKIPSEVWDLYDKLGGNIHLDGAWRYAGGHTVFGQVFDGMDVVEKIAAVKVDSETNKPLQAVTIKSVEITTY